MSGGHLPFACPDYSGMFLAGASQPGVLTRPRPLSRPVAGLLFDMGGILHDDTAWRRWLLRLLKQLGLNTHYQTFYRVWDRDFLLAVHRGQQDFGAAFRQFLRSVGLSPAQIDEVEAAAQARRRQLDENTRALPGVKTTLGRLQQAGFALGVLNNSEHPATTLDACLERIGLGGLFSTVVSSIDLGHAKPEAACYLAAADQMQINPLDVAFVGHDTEELSGAAAVGMATIGFNFDNDAQADVFIARFEELLEVVHRRQPYAAAS